MKFSFSGNQDIYLEIAQRYKEYIRQGILRNGEKLPSVRQAAGELSVNPNTVAKAYQELERTKVIYSLSGRGSFVAKIREMEIRDTILEDFDTAVREALRAGVSVQELQERIAEIGKTEEGTI